MIDRLAPNFNDIPGRRTVPQLYAQGAAKSDYIDVSILTPYFNTEDFFWETFVCLQAQSLQNWEWIIVDDGSSDTASVERLKKAATLDARIQVVHQPNAGPSAARNRAFKNAVGRYICLLDSDDMIEHTYLEKAVWFLDSNREFGFCNSWSVVFGDQEYLWTTGFERGVAHLQANSGPPISVIRHSAFSEMGGFDESIRFGHEDWDFWLAMAKAGHWGYTIQEYLQWYRKRGNGRFEQIMRSDGVNVQFESLMHKKYSGLESTFPNPHRTHASPYTTLKTAPEVSNALVSKPKGHSFLFLVPWMTTGGADRVNLDLTEGLVENGHRVTVCASLAADHRWESEFSRFTPDIFILPNFLAAEDYPRFLAYLIASRQVDTVLITGSAVGYQFLPFLRSSAPDVAFIDMSHVEELHWNNGGHPRFGVGYQDQLDLNIVTTARLARWMRSRGAQSSRIEVMYTGIRTSQSASMDDPRASVRSQYGIPMDCPIIVFAGRLCEQKRPVLLAHILQSIHDESVAFHALIIGDGELRVHFEWLVGHLGLSGKVQMLGSQPHNQWLRILAGSDVLLMPSQYEGISIALLEAMASGVVPVVADVGGQSEIVSPDSGFLIPHGDTELAHYTTVLRTLLTDQATLSRMGQSAQNVAQSVLSWSGMIQNFLRLVDQAHDLRVSAPRQTLPIAFSSELATMALENKRLGEAVDWLWHTSHKSPATETNPALTSAELQAVTRIALRLSQTWLARRLIRNKTVKSIVRWMLNRAAGPSAS